jgi:hypothetical protein
MGYVRTVKKLLEGKKRREKKKTQIKVDGLRRTGLQECWYENKSFGQNRMDICCEGAKAKLKGLLC